MAGFLENPKYIFCFLRLEFLKKLRRRIWLLANENKNVNFIYLEKAKKKNEFSHSDLTSEINPRSFFGSTDAPAFKTSNQSKCTVQPGKAPLWLVESLESLLLSSAPKKLAVYYTNLQNSVNSLGLSGGFFFKLGSLLRKPKLSFRKDFNPFCTTAAALLSKLDMRLLIQFWFDAFLPGKL